jgi:hypothetical protein
MNNRLRVATENEVSAFNRRWPPSREGWEACCTISNLRIDLHGPPRSPWNRSAARVFAADFASFHQMPLTPTVFDDVTRRFLTRVKTLKAKWGNHNQSFGDRLIQSQAARRWQRKRIVRCSSPSSRPVLTHRIIAIPSSPRYCQSTSASTSTHCHVTKNGCRRNVLR